MFTRKKNKMTASLKKYGISKQNRQQFEIGEQMGDETIKATYFK